MSLIFDFSNDVEDFTPEITLKAMGSNRAEKILMYNILNGAYGEPTILQEGSKQDGGMATQIKLGFQKKTDPSPPIEEPDNDELTVGLLTFVPLSEKLDVGNVFSDGESIGRPDYTPYNIFLEATLFQGVPTVLPVDGGGYITGGLQPGGFAFFIGNKGVVTIMSAVDLLPITAGESIVDYIQKHDISVMWNYVFSPEQIEMFESLTTETIQTMHNLLIKMRIYKNKKWWKLKTDQL